MKFLSIVLIILVVLVGGVFLMSFLSCDAIVTSFNKLGSAGEDFETTVTNFVNYDSSDGGRICSVTSKEIAQSEYTNQGIEKTNVVFSCEDSGENTSFNFSFYTKDNKVYVKSVGMGPCGSNGIYYNEEICSKDMSYCTRFLKN